MEKQKLKTLKNTNQYRQIQEIRQLFQATMTDFKNDGLRPFSDIKQEQTDENNDLDNIDTNLTSLIGTPNKKLQQPKNENNDSTPVNF